MGPDEEMLELARHLIAEHPSITVDPYTLAYTIQAWCEAKEAADPPKEPPHA